MVVLQPRLLGMDHSRGEDPLEITNYLLVTDQPLALEVALSRQSRLTLHNTDTASSVTSEPRYPTLLLVMFGTARVLSPTRLFFRPPASATRPP